MKTIGSIFVRTYLAFVGLILAVTCLAKIYPILKAKAINGYDEVTGLPNFILNIIATIFEITVIVYLISSRSKQKKAALAVWTGCVFLIYHTLFLIFHSGKYCPCFGIFASFFNLSSMTNDALAFGLSSYMIIGGFYFRTKTQYSESAHKIE